MLMWQDWVNAFLGIMLVLLVALGITGNTLTLLAGVAIAAFGIWGAMRNQGAEDSRTYTFRRDYGLYAE